MGRDADLIIVQGDASAQINDIENVAIVCRDGNAYDAGKLLDSVRGRYAEY